MSDADARTPLIPDGLEATLVLLRHGETEWILEGRFQGQSETPLSPLGRRQAELAAGRLTLPHASPALPVPPGPPLAIVHSPLVRTAQTAALVADALAAAGTPVPRLPDDGLREIGQGEWEGRTHVEIAERWREELAAWRRTPTRAWAPGGEPLAAVQARVRDSLAGILARLGEGFPRGTLDREQVAGYRGAATAEQPWAVLVGHDGIFKVLLLTLFDLPLERFWMWTFALCGVSVVEIRAGRPVLRAHNLTEHLSPLLEEQAIEVAEERERTGAL